MPRALSVNWETIKALYAIHGASETARRTGLNVNTVCARAKRGGWKQVVGVAQVTHEIKNMTPADAIAATLTEAKEKSTVALARYTERASEAAAKSSKPLEVARKVRDVSAVYQALWPSEKHSSLIQSAILLNPDQVIDAEESGGVPKGLPEA